MKKAVLLFTTFILFVSTNIWCSDSLKIVMLNHKIDSLSNVILRTDTTNKKTILEIKDADKIFGDKNDWWDKLSPALIALLTIVLSSVGAYKIAIYTSKEQRDLTMRQNSSQIAIATEQMKSNHTVAIAQVKANNISSANILWIQNLRTLLSEMIHKLSIMEEILEPLKNYRKKENKNEITTAERKELLETVDKFEILFETLAPQFNQIKLYLDDQNIEQADLITGLNSYLNNALIRSLGKEVEIEITEDELINKSRLVLKKAWEQVKNNE